MAAMNGWFSAALLLCTVVRYRACSQGSSSSEYGIVHTSPLLLHALATAAASIRTAVEQAMIAINSLRYKR